MLQKGRKGCKMRERALGSVRLENQTYKSLFYLKGYSGCKDPNNNNRNPSCIYNSTFK
jgi:hypothetical protein